MLSFDLELLYLYTFIFILQVEVVDLMMERQITLKLDCHYVISAICSFIGAFLSADKNDGEKKQNFVSLRVKEFDQVINPFFDGSHDKMATIGV